jgi:hypothetical protein
MESTNYTLTVSPLKVAGVIVVIVAILLFVGAHFLWTSIGSLKGQVAEQHKQLEEAKNQEKAQQEKVDAMWNFLVQATQQQPQAQQPQPTK